jgi:hypothetical protein
MIGYHLLKKACKSLPIRVLRARGWAAKGGGGDERIYKGLHKKEGDARACFWKWGV